jgi:hypothetical protein
MTTTTMSTAPANDNNEQPPDDELLPDEGEMNNKIERSVAAFGNKEALSIRMPRPLRSKRRVRLEHDAELQPRSKKRRKYQRRNSKVASMLTPLVTKRIDEESFSNSSTKEPPFTATKNKRNKQHASSLESTLRMQPEGSDDREKETIEDAAPRRR